MSDSPRKTLFLLLSATIFIPACKNGVVERQKEASLAKSQNAIASNCFRLADDHDHEGEEAAHADEHALEGENAPTVPPKRNQNSVDCSKTPPANTSPAIKNELNFTVKLETCSALGKVWLPFGGPNNEAICGIPNLVNFCCSMKNVAAAYKAMPASVSNDMQTFVNQGYKLYNCASAGDRQEFHLIQVNDNQVFYKGFIFSGGQVDSSQARDSACVAPSMENLGLSKFMVSPPHDDHDDDHGEHDDDHDEHDDDHDKHDDDHDKHDE